MAKSKSQRKKAQIAVETRRNKVAILLLSGASQRKIATTLDVSVGTINGDVRALRKVWQKENSRRVDDAMTLDLDRIDRLLMSYWNKALNGDINAAQYVAGLLDRRRAIFGYQAPKKIALDASGIGDISMIEVHLSTESDSPTD